MDGLSKQIIDNESDYMLNLGSETIPPCKENVIHISLQKPLHIPSCQFKLLREGSLVSSRAKEIHTRIQKENNDRQIYSFDNTNINYLNSLAGLVPDSYEDYNLYSRNSIKERKNIQKRKRNKNNKKERKNIRKRRTEKVLKMFKPKRRGFGPGYKAGRVIKEAKDECFVPVD